MTLIDKAEAHDDDLIRRGDIGPRLAEAGFGGELLQDAIRALPARGVGVKPLVWRDSYGVLRAETPFGDYKVSGRILYRPGNLAPQSTHIGTAEAQAAAQEDYEVRIFAALEPTGPRSAVAKHLQDLRDAKSAALATEAAQARVIRNGEHLFNTAKSLGWADDGEGALEFVMRRTREVALEDAAKAAAQADYEARILAALTAWENRNA